MSIEIPHYRQEKANTCGLACLRMVLAAYGQQVSESELQAQARMEQRGVHIAELERLARLYNLVAEIQETTIDDLRRLLQEGKLPIAYIDRAVFEMKPSERVAHSIRHAKIHTVIPTGVTARYVRLLDPLESHFVRRSIRRLQEGHEPLGSLCVVCSQAGEG